MLFIDGKLVPFAFLKITNAARSNDLMMGTYTHAHACRSQSGGELRIRVRHGFETTAIANLTNDEYGPSPPKRE